MRLGVVSLGCDKATVDSEALLARFVGHGAVVTADLGDADVILVNTCGFIDAAKRESIEAARQPPGERRVGGLVDRQDRGAGRRHSAAGPR